MQLVAALRFTWNKLLFENFCKYSDDVAFNYSNVGTTRKPNDHPSTLVASKVALFKNIRIMIIYLCD